MRSTFIFTLIILSSITSFSQRPVLIPYRVGNLWGFCDTAGIVKIKPEYQNAKIDPYNGLLIVTKNNKKHIIDFNGKVTIKSFDTCGIYGVFKTWDNPVSDDVFVWVKDDNGKFGLKTTTGKQIIPMIYDDLYYNYRNIKESLYARKGDSIYVVPVNSKGEKTYYTTLGKGESFKRPISSDNYDAPPEIVPVLTSDENNDQAEAELNKVLEQIKASYRLDSVVAIPYLYYDLTCYTYKNGKVGLWNDKFVITPAYDSIGDVNLHGAVIIAKKDNKAGIISTNGTVKIPFKYDNIHAYNHNIFITGKAGKKGFIVFRENRVLEFPPSLPNIERFSELSFNDSGFVLFRATEKGRLIGFIGENGIKYFRD